MRMYFAHTIPWIILIFTSLTQATIPSDMEAMIDKDVNPCNDFYRYACGGWMKTKSLEPNERMISSFLHISKTNTNIIHRVMEKKPPIVREFWDSCMNVDKLKTLGNKPLQENLNRILKVKTKNELRELAGEFSELGSHIFFKYMVRYDVEGGGEQKLQISSADLILTSPKYYTKPKFSVLEKDYREYITKLMKVSGFSFIPKDRSIADIVIDIDKRFAKLKNLKLVSIMSVGRSTKLYPNTVRPYLDGLRVVYKAAINTNSLIYLSSDLEDIEKLTDSISVDDLRVYTAFAYVNGQSHFLGPDFTDLRFNFFDKHMLGVTVQGNRESLCTRYVIKYFPDLIGKYFYQEAFDQEREKYALDMLTSIQQAMDTHLSNAFWLTPGTKSEAKKKLSNIGFRIGQSKAPKHHVTNFSRDNFYDTMRHILMAQTNRLMDEIGHPYNRNEWATSAATLDAYYEPWTNSLEIPAAVLQPPMFNGSRFHPARNFGAIGSLMGHEIIHAFDQKGRQFDKNGRVKNWWSIVSRIVYWYRTRCMRKQYSRFQVHTNDGTSLGSLNWKLSINENIADNGGLSIAWDAYRKYMIKNNIATHDGESDKIFFLSFGQMWCSKSQDEFIEHRHYKDPHPPHNWRVNGAVMNNQNFAKVFNCQLHTPMNPPQKCRIW